MAEIRATCHCGAVSVIFAKAPAEVVKCNCSLCSKYGVLWTYQAAADVRINPDGAPTDIYAWNGHNVYFHRCAGCGCVTHWIPRDHRDRRGLNARLLEPEVFRAAKVVLRDGAGTGVFTD